MYIKMQRVYMLIISIVVAHIVFLKWAVPYFYNYEKNIFYISGLSSIVLAFEFIKCLNKRYFSIILLASLSVFIIMSSAIINRGLNPGNWFMSLRLSLSIICFTLFLVVSCEKGILIENLRNIFFTILFYCIISDVLMIVKPIGIWSMGEFTGQYLVGSKFELSYLHFWLVIFYLKLFEEKRYIKYILLFWTLIVSIYDHCNTMVIGIIFFSLVILFFNEIKFLLYSKLFILFFMIVFNSILVIGGQIIQMPFIQNLLVNILHENATLSGRMNIYSRFASLSLVNPLFGVSLDLNYDFSYFNTLAANYQNGIVDIFVSWGLFGVIGIVALFIYACIYSKKVDEKVIISSLYTLIILSAGEIVFRSMPVLLVLLLVIYGVNIQSSKNAA